MAPTGALAMRPRMTCSTLLTPRSRDSHPKLVTKNRVAFFGVRWHSPISCCVYLTLLLASLLES